MAFVVRIVCSALVLLVPLTGEKVIDINKTPIQKKRGECVTLKAHHYFQMTNKKITWYKYSIPIDGTFTNAILENDKVTIERLTPSDAALYWAETRTEAGREITRYWLTVKDCATNEAKTSFRDCDIACEVKCETGWDYFNDKCYKYFPAQRAWEDAHSSCQSHGAKLATIDGAEENSFVGNLLKTGDGGWIGLNDKSQESYYVWNYERNSKPSYFAWDKSNPRDEEPNNYNGRCNIENCVELKYATRKWNDAVCNAQFGYICQFFSEKDILGWTCNSGKCYKYSRLQVAWDEARVSCQNMNATLVTITSSSENNFVASMITGSTWIGLNDRAESETYVWNDVGVDQFQHKTTYTNWDTGEPSDKIYNKQLPRCPGEDCVQIKKWIGSVTWSDLGCSTALPYVCEKRKDMFISFAAWIAITMGAGLVFSIVAARGYMEFKTKRGKKDVKALITGGSVAFR